MEQTKEMIICPQCKGAGQVYRLNRNGAPCISHGEPVLDFCALCEGNGRLLRITTVEYMRIPIKIINAEDCSSKQNVFDKIKSIKKKML